MTTETSTSLSTLEYALNYARSWDWAVFPLHSVTPDGFCTCGNASCKSEGKHPRTATGCLEASKDPDQINAWWDQWPDANIGIATGQISNLVVVDVDSGKGANHSDLIIDSIDQLIFNTPKVKTGQGMHYYYSCPAGTAIRNSASKLGEFIDVRGDGGYVVAPPSKHISGKSYEFWGTIDAQPLEFPEAWIDKLNAPTPAAAANRAAAAQPVTNGHIYVPPPAEALHVPESIKQGTRNHELTKIAGMLRRHGLSEGAILNALLVENQRICKPPLDDKEVHQIARSIGRYAPHEILGALSDPDAAAAPEDDDYENTLMPYFYGDFLDQQFEEKEILSFHIGKRDIAIIQAATNAGKTTLLRNIAMCMAAGRPFMPFYGRDRGRSGSLISISRMTPRTCSEISH
jgi:putative DNA primase/helicase